jgi:hypothetical protein
MIGIDNTKEYFKESVQTHVINESLVLRFNIKPNNSPLCKYLLVLNESETKINSKIPFFDIFSLNSRYTYKIMLKKLKKLNRKNIGIEIKIREIRNSNSYEVGKWIKSIKEINKFCKLTDNQLIISSGAETNYESISGNTFDSILRILEIEPMKYWNELEKWIDTRANYGPS